MPVTTVKKIDINEVYSSDSKTYIKNSKIYRSDRTANSADTIILTAHPAGMPENKRIPSTKLAVMTVKYTVPTAKFTAQSTKRMVLSATSHKPTATKAYSTNIKAKTLTVKYKYGEQGLLQYSEFYKIIPE